MPDKISKNAPCPCGSGKKYKRCCFVEGKRNAPPAPPKSCDIRQVNGIVRRFNIMVIPLIIILGLSAYANTFNAPFTFDDAIITQQREKGEATSLKSIVGRQRPVSYLSFDLNYAIGGDDPFIYHLTSIVIHLLTAITIYFLVLTTLNLPSLRDRYGETSRYAAAVASLLFVVHPVHTQAVTYIVQRMTSLAAMFYLMSVLAYVKGRIVKGRKGVLLIVGSLFLAVLAIGSKQHTVTILVALLMYELFFFQGLDFKKFVNEAVVKVFLSGLLVMGVGVFFVQDMGYLATGYDQYPFTMVQKGLTEFRVIIYYISLLVLPHPSRLNLDYDYAVSRSLFSPPATFICFVVLVGLIVLAGWLARKRPLISFSIFWFLGHLVLESFLLPIEIIYEHRLYLPSLGFFMIVAVALSWFFEPERGKNIMPLGIGIVAVLVLVSGFWTYQRNTVWGSEISLWSDVVKKSPNKARPHNNLGKAYATASLEPGAPPEMGDKAIEEYLLAVKLNPANYVAFDNLGQAYGRKGMTDEAIRACLESVRLKPDYLQAHNNLGVAYNKKKNYEEAVKHCLEAIKINPRYAKAYFNLGRGYDGKGEYDKAVEAFEKARALRPDDANVPYNIGNAYFNQGKVNKAVEFYRQTLKMNPGFINAYYNLGVIYFNKADYKSALEQYRKIIEISPRYAPAYERMGLIYMDKIKDYKSALKNFKKALEFFKTEGQAKLAREAIKRLRAKGVNVD